MTLYFLGIAILLLTGIFSLCFSKAKYSLYLSFYGQLVNFLLISFSSLIFFKKAANNITYSLSSFLPELTFSFRVDMLSFLFILPVILISTLASFYAISYLPDTSKTKTSCFWFNLLTSSMLLVLLSSNALLFLFFWELMALSSFFLVSYDAQKKEIRMASWIYILFSHFGVFFIIGGFYLLYLNTNSFEFESFIGTDLSHSTSSIIFLLLLTGFGSKAGFIPFHIWLPKAHPVAPSHVSALMSGIMIKIGIYGILRSTTFCASAFTSTHIPLLILSIGVISAIIAIIFALLQDDIKKLLAYSSIENIGIILIGIGLGTFAISKKQNFSAILALSGALLHIFNHSIFKSLLFLSAGSLIKMTGEHNINKMGGLLKKNSFLGINFLIGSASISSIPLFNGFISEFMILFAAFYMFINSNDVLVISIALLTILTLIFVSSIVTICFVKTFATVFLGESKINNDKLKKIGATSNLPCTILSFICIFVGLWAIYIVHIPLAISFEILHGFIIDNSVVEKFSFFFQSLAFGTIIFIIFILILSMLILVRKFLLCAKDEETITVTWDCSYLAPSSRMQYTGSSLVSPFTEFCNRILGVKFKTPIFSSIYPKPTKFEMIIPDFMEKLILKEPGKIISFLSRFISRYELLPIQFHIFLMVLLLLILIVWSFCMI